MIITFDTNMLNFVPSVNRRKEIYHVKKRTVFTAVVPKFNALEKPPISSPDFTVRSVTKLLFGNKRMLKNIAHCIGLSYGLTKAIPFVNFLNYPDRAFQNLTASKIIGSINLRLRFSLSQNIAISSLTALIFTRTGVL